MASADQMSSKEAVIRTAAATRKVRLSTLAAECGRHRSVFYRVVKGQATSAPIDRFLINRLCINPELLEKTV